MTSRPDESSGAMGAQPDISALSPEAGFPCPEALPAMHALVRIVACLRAPKGCPWDREQSQLSMAPHLLEEAFEAVDAIGNAYAKATSDQGAAPHAEVCEELGDVLMNVLMIAQIASESGAFDLEDVARVTAEKLVRRHPHVFGDEKTDSPEATLRLWESIKRKEAGSDQPRSALAGVPAALPALHRALRVTEKAARAGFDWQTEAGPRRKIDEELTELDQAFNARKDAAPGGAEQPDLERRIEEELGDVLFSLVNWARHAGVHPEMALRRTVDRFSARFQHVEAELGDRLKGADESTLDQAWERAKRAESANNDASKTDP